MSVEVERQLTGGLFLATGAVAVALKHVMGILAALCQRCQIVFLIVARALVQMRDGED